MSPFITNPFIFAGGCPPCCCPTGSWKELGRTTLSCAGDTISVACLPDKRYLMTLTYQDGCIVSMARRYNSDSCMNYSNRSSTDGGADATGVCDTNLHLINIGTAAESMYNIYAVNRSANEKLFIIQYTNLTAAGAATGPTRVESAAKHVTTGTQINHIGLVESTGNLTNKTVIKVWGAD